MLEVQKLSKSYGKSLAVDEVSFLYRMVQSGSFWDQTEPENRRSSKVSQVCFGIRGGSEFRDFLPEVWRQRDSLPMFRRCLPCLMHSASENTSNT